MKKTTTIAAAALLIAVGAQGKKVLDHNSFDSWQSVKNGALSRNGEWAAVATVPQEGDATLLFYNSRNGKRIEVSRGYKPTFTANGKWGLALVKPLYSQTRQAKIDKKKDFDMPQDSLAIVNLSTGAVELIPRVISYQTGRDGGEWIAYQSCDTTLIKPDGLKEKEAGRPLVVRDLNSGSTKTVNWVKDYVFSKNGERLAFNMKKPAKDSLATDGLGVVLLPDTALYLIDREKAAYGNPVFNETATMLAYTATQDSAKSGTPRYDLYIADLTKENFDPEIIHTRTTQFPRANPQPPHAADPELQAKLEKEAAEERSRTAGAELVLNQYSKPEFSKDGRRIIVGVAPYIAPDDTTIVDFERADLDIWVWDTPFTPPQENITLNEWKKKGCTMAIDVANRTGRLLSNTRLADVKGANHWNADWALVLDPTQDIVSWQWDICAPVNASIINLNNGDIRKIGTVYREDGNISPDGKYVIWFNDRDWHCYNIATGETVNLTQNTPYPFWDEDDDHPMKPMPYGIAGWGKDDEAVLLYDRHDIWSFDPTGKKNPVNVTAGEGRNKNLRYRYKQTDPEKLFFNNGDELLLNLFSYENKKNGFATMKYGKTDAPEVKVLDEYSFRQILKAKDAPVYTWQMANFSVSPQIYLAKGNDFKKTVRLTDANPQMKDYNWGTAELVKWYAYNGKLTEGVLYKPEDWDPNKKYPMLTVFYETNADQLYTHYNMEPSWSWVNYPFYVSRGYVVFVPDIHYTPGVPGESAYNYVCSGVEELCKRYPWIDKDRVGIDGQSWGGYQTAYLVTRTNMFACAGSGAPVANMTSAFGGIRWESGDSRQLQYEQGQSRIGRNLWEAPELYIANSPVFHADRVNTPLLIMHNDADGAVPWYQGIEMFMALRRLQKPVWMLQYNGEAHNIKARKNRKDITIRLQQFFDHYLKGDPMPEWMKRGIRAERKGQDMGY